jgi:aminopeptidase N
VERAGRVVAAVAAGALVLAGCTDDPKPSGAQPPASPSPSPSFSAGAEGIGDPYFPTAGNGGYDVASYDLNLAYAPGSGQLTGSATIKATATQDLSRFDFDLAKLTASRVTVDGRAATAKATGDELVVTPAAGIVRGTAFTVVVDYGGKPEDLPSKALGDGGWFRTKDGAFALGQPDSASAWYPVNDHPADKAAFSLAMTVPDGLEVLSNGVPGERTSGNGKTTWRWSEASPLASYLSTVVIGQFRVETTTHAGKPLVTAIPAALPADGPAAQSLARTGEIADFLATQFGPYPFDAYGGVVIDDARVAYALEVQSRPVYGNVFFSDRVDFGVVAHELAHQWFGDSVALARWQDIWLNEGFATYAEWLWSEHEGRETAQQLFDRQYARSDWKLPIGDPGAARIFDRAVYDRGGMTVHALRRTIGDAAFFELLKSWTGERRDGNARTADFVKAAEQVSGKDLDPFFQAWLFGTTKPPPPA